MQALCTEMPWPWHKRNQPGKTRQTFTLKKRPPFFFFFFLLV
uniref:Alternative protein QRICH1 n=1 Tax=Homo sapiens TaxID=9606 RepID=L8E8D2_HUMAN|nr:alternative protein QRICH1 [Homo sapiens]